MADDFAAKGAARSRKLGLPVLKVPSPDYRNQVSRPGSSCCVRISTDGKTVLKTAVAFHVDGCSEEVAHEYEAFSCESQELLDREREIYLHLGNEHPGILRYLDITDEGILFPCLKNGDLRHYLLTSKTPIPRTTKKRWITTALETFIYLHSKGILQADISARNFLVTDDMGIVVCDFSGSAIGGKRNMVRPETRYEKFVADKDYVEVGIETEIFAIGCVMFEIETGRRPFDRIEDEGEVERRVKVQEWEITEGMWAGKVVRGCWEGSFGRVKEVLRAVESMGWEGEIEL